VRDLGRLARLRVSRAVVSGHTGVADLAALQGLDRLEPLDRKYTAVGGLAPLAQRSRLAGPSKLGAKSRARPRATADGS
jgi:hypothetical protein